MKTTRNYWLCASITLAAGIFIHIGSWMMSGNTGIEPIRESVEVALLIWLVTGSGVARWIIGILAALVVVAAAVGTVWIVIDGFNLSGLGSRQRLSFVIVGIAVVMHGFVAWRLLIWPSSNRFNQKADPTRKLNAQF